MYILVYGWQKFPNSSRKPIKKFLHFKMLTFQNVKLEMSEYSNKTPFGNQNWTSRKKDTIV